MTTRSKSTGRGTMHAHVARLSALVAGAFAALPAVLVLDVPAASARAITRVPYGRAVPLKVVGGQGTDVLLVAAILAVTALLIGGLSWATATGRRPRPSGRSAARSRARGAELARGKQTRAR